MSEHKVNSLLLAHYNYVVNVKVIDLSKAGIKFVPIIFCQNLKCLLVPELYSLYPYFLENIIIK